MKSTRLTKIQYELCETDFFNLCKKHKVKPIKILKKGFRPDEFTPLRKQIAYELYNRENTFKVIGDVMNRSKDMIRNYVLSIDTI